MNTHVRDNENVLKTTINNDGTLKGTYNLLKANSGASSATTTTTLDTFAMSGLTALDLVVVELSFDITGNSHTGFDLRNTTDNVTLYTGPGSAGNPDNHRSTNTIGPWQGDTKKISTLTLGHYTLAGGIISSLVSTFTTDWTGSWTLALRTLGGVSGVSMKWRWAVRKLAGQ